MNFPNLLTWLRLILIPVFVIFFLIPYTWTHKVVAGIFIIAAITDWFDGYLARKWNQTSDFGAFLDPVADKLMVATAIILIVYDNPQWYIVVPAIVIISREITISALREWMATLGSSNRVAVSWTGKCKTTMQMIALIFMLYRENIYNIPIYMIGLVCFILATILTLWSMVQYLNSALAKAK